MYYISDVYIHGMRRKWFQTFYKLNYCTTLSLKYRYDITKITGVTMNLHTKSKL